MRSFIQPHKIICRYSFIQISSLDLPRRNQKSVASCQVVKLHFIKKNKWELNGSNKKHLRHCPVLYFFSLSFLLVVRLPQNKFCVQYFSTHVHLYHLSFISCCCSVVILLAGSGGRPFVHALARLFGFYCVVIVQSASHTEH